jgi:hypothetical protein
MGLLVLNEYLRNYPKKFKLFSWIKCISLKTIGSIRLSGQKESKELITFGNQV